MALDESIKPDEAVLVASGAYTWYGDAKPLPITETWRILRARTGYVLESTADASAAPAFGHTYTAALSLDATMRATGLVMQVTKGAHSVTVAAHFEPDGAVITRRMTGDGAKEAIQRTQTFRMAAGYTIEAHPVLFDGLHIAACDLSQPGPYQRPAFWFDISATEPHALMAGHLVNYAIDAWQGLTPRGTYAFTGWGGDMRAASTLLTVRQIGPWFVPTELRFTMTGVLYSARLADDRWEERATSNE